MQLLSKRVCITDVLVINTITDASLIYKEKMVGPVGLEPTTNRL